MDNIDFTPTGLKGAHCSERFRRDASAPFFRDMQFTSIFTCSGAPRWAARAFMKAAETTSNYPLELSRGSRGCPEAAERLQDASEGPLGGCEGVLGGRARDSCGRE